MKNSKEYSRRTKKLFKQLKREHDHPENVSYDEPVDAVIYGIVSEQITEKQASSALKKIKAHFVSWNGLRVSRVEEITEVLGKDTDLNRQIASSLVRALRAVFERNNTVSLQELKKTGKRAAKQVIAELDGVNHFAANYCAVTAIEAHAIALTGKMIEYLRAGELVHHDADEQDIEGFLTRIISASEAEDFYHLLRAESESRGLKSKKRKAGKKASAGSRKKKRSSGRKGKTRDGRKSRK